ncbi:MAG: STM4012 family radical SAM protein [Planctomycetes bacterium]|nr:STM4012 family radical SAM protein [Planctomycetota bacterium]
MKTLTTDLARRLQGSPYQGYAYAYPHKSAYRALEGRPLEEVWAAEARDALFLYIHVPFCEFRCGFCNLFTQHNPHGSLIEAYLETLTRETAQVQAALRAGGEPRFARFAIGGGTPTQLDLAGLTRLFDLAEQLGASPLEVPVSIEMSPDTIDPEKLALLRERGVDRASMGVQSFLEDESRAAGRPQKTAQVEQAIEWIQAAGFPIMNLDLIYGLPSQTSETWETSLARLIDYAPAEVFLYPLYVRPLTGLGRRDGCDEAPDDPRLNLYRQGRDRLLGAGYEQISMRLFRRPEAGLAEAPAYRCQEDGMVGLGCGARSYTKSLHYSGEYAVGARGVREILSRWVSQTDEELSRVAFGFELDAVEQRRRYAIQSLLHSDGLSYSGYRDRFGSDVLSDLPALSELGPRGLAVEQEAGLHLTPEGIERSDVLGPWLFSTQVLELMEAGVGIFPQVPDAQCRRGW